MAVKKMPPKRDNEMCSTCAGAGKKGGRTCAACGGSGKKKK